MSYEQRYRPEWQREADQLAEASVECIDAIYFEYLPLIVLEREGRATGLDTGARRVTVTLLPVANRAGATVRAAYGQPSYSAGQIVGKRVRVWERIEFRLEATRPVVVSKTYTIDTVFGGQ